MSPKASFPVLPGLRLIVQHTPKCAGTSLTHALQAAFGKDAVFRDLDDKLTDPASLFQSDRAAYWAAAREVIPDQPVVIGHFPLHKYRHLGQALRVGTIRHPLARAISHYCYWKAAPNRLAHHLQHLVQAGKLGILEFVRVPAIRHFYRDIYFAGATAVDYDLMIRQEEYAEGIARLSALLGQPLEVLHSRVTATAEEAAMCEDTVLLRRLHAELAEDVAIHDALTGST